MLEGTAINQAWTPCESPFSNSSACLKAAASLEVFGESNRRARDEHALHEVQCAGRDVRLMGEMYVWMVIGEGDALPEPDHTRLLDQDKVWEI